MREISGADQERADRVVTEALELARTIGDPELRALALVAEAEVIPPDLDPERREALRREMAEIAERHDLPVFEVLVAVLDVQQLVLVLELDEAAAAAGPRPPARRPLPDGADAGRHQDDRGHVAHARGDLERSAELYTEAFHANVRGGGVNAEGIWILAMVTVRREQGRLPELVDMLPRAVRAVPGPRLGRPGAGPDSRPANATRRAALADISGRSRATSSGRC